MKIRSYNKKNFIKKMGIYAISFFPFGLAATAVVSCAGFTADSSDLTIGIRPEDDIFWTNVKTQFEKATGKKVKLKWVIDQQNNYSLWSGDNSLPDVAIADSAWARIGNERGWFQKFDLKNVVENKEYMIQGVDDIYKEKEIKFDDKTFDTAIMNSFKEGDEYFGQAFISGPKFIYSWKKIPNGSGGYIDLFDGQSDLNWYVPNPRNGSLDKVDSFTGSNASKNNSPLFDKKDGHRFKNTIEDVQKFISNAINVEDLKFNSDNFKDKISNPGSPKDRVISTTEYGMVQRIASVYQTILEAKKSQLANDVFGLINNPGPDWAGLSFGKKGIAKSKKEFDNESTFLTKDSILDENKVFNPSKNITSLDPYKLNPRINNRDLHQISELEAIEYFSKAGYFASKAMPTSGSVGSDDAQLSFGKAKALALIDGAAWQMNSILQKVKEIFKNENPSDLLVTFGQPIQITGVDGFALANNIKGERLKLAKKFLRFLMQPKVAAEIASNKALATIIEAQPLQKKMSGILDSGFDNSGKKPFVSDGSREALEIPTNLVLGSIRTENGKKVSQIFSVYTEQWIQNKDLDTGKSSGSYNGSADSFFAILEKIGKDYEKAIATDENFGSQK